MKYFFKLLLSTSAAIAFTATGQAQTPALQQSSHWSIYNVQGKKFYRIVPDSLSAYNNRALNDDSMRQFLAHSTELPSKKPPVWMGAYVTSCIVDHKMRKIDISSYGGFFYDETDKKYYGIQQQMQKEWLDYLAACAGSVPSQK